MTAPFISRDDLSDYLGRDVSADDGALIAVDSACEIVRTLTEQDFNEVTETIKLDGTGTDTLLLPQSPVSTVGTVVVNAGTLESDDYAFTEEGRLFRTSGTATNSSWVRGGQPLAYWAPGRQNVEVTYTHGYAGTVPSDVRMVALMLAYRMVSQGGAISEQVGVVSKRYAAAATDLTNGEAAILRKYRRVRSA